MLTNYTQQLAFRVGEFISSWIVPKPHLCQFLLLQVHLTHCELNDQRLGILFLEKNIHLVDEVFSFSTMMGGVYQSLIIISRKSVR